jgi:hypothetical protein
MAPPQSFLDPCPEGSDTSGTDGLGWATHTCSVLSLEEGMHFSGCDLWMPAAISHRGRLRARDWEKLILAS